METIFGITLKLANYTEVILIIVFIMLAIAFYSLIRYNQHLIQKKNQSKQLFLFKLKQLGLSNFQTKILYSIINTLDLPDPNRVLEDAALFESAIGSFLKFLQNKSEKKESLSNICRELIITYERLYRPSAFQHPLETVADIQPGQLFYITQKDGDTTFIGKLLKTEGELSHIRIFRHVHDLKISENIDILAYIWRAGDAEYFFDSRIIEIGPDTLIIKTAVEFNRGKEVRRPYVDVVIPCAVREYSENADDEEDSRKKKNQNELSGVVYKLHEDELVLRSSVKMDYRKKYELLFTISDFKMRIVVILIADRTLQEENVFYYTFRYVEISDAAKNLLKKYIMDRM